MNSTILDLLRQGLVMTALGMGLVFAGLGLLWALMALLTRLLTERAVAEAPAALPATVAPGPTPAASADAIPAALALTAERQQVAAIIAGALLANAPAHSLPRAGRPGTGARTRFNVVGERQSQSRATIVAAASASRA